MSQKSLKEYIEVMRQRYVGRGRTGRSRLIDELCALGDFERKYAIKVLRRQRRTNRVSARGKKSVRYGKEVQRVLEVMWRQSEQMCGKRLQPALALWLPHYERRKGALQPEIRAKVLSISAPQIDRLLAQCRARTRRQRRGGTRPGTLLRQQIPVRTEHWEINCPGYLEADTVAHGGESTSGDFIWSLTATDIFSGWTELRAVWNKGAHGVCAQIEAVEKALPFALLGFDCDNGSEFLNHHLWSYFGNGRRGVDFTRSRPYRKNDNAHVEQKNWTHVRCLLGYERLDDPELVEAINRLYRGAWSQLHNFFSPSLKLLEKKREGGKCRKRYAKACTPVQRLLAWSGLTPVARAHLESLERELDPFALKASVERQLRDIFTLRRRLAATREAAA